MFRAYHTTVPRLYGDVARMVRMACQDPVLACRAGIECGCCVTFNSPDAGVRTYLLLRDLSVRCFSGCDCEVRQEREEVALFLFACAFLAALWSAGCFCGGFSGGGRFLCRFAGALQCLRAYCQQLAPAALDVGKQFVGLSGGTDGQLRFLRGGCLDEEPADAFSCGRYGGRAFRLGLAERAYVLQYDLSGGDSVGLHLPLFPLSHHDRYGEMQQLRPLYPPMQGSLYRRQAA